MVKFWLDDFKDLISPDNFDLNDRNKVLNVVSLSILLISLLVSLKTKNEFYFGAGFIILSILIIIHNKMQYFSGNTGFIYSGGNTGLFIDNTIIAEKSQNIQTTSNTTILTEDSFKNDNRLILNNIENLNAGDIINISGNNNKESNIIGSVNKILSL